MNAPVMVDVGDETDPLEVRTELARSARHSPDTTSRAVVLLVLSGYSTANTQSHQSLKGLLFGPLIP